MIPVHCIFSPFHSIRQINPSEGRAYAQYLLCLLPTAMWAKWMVVLVVERRSVGGVGEYSNFLSHQSFLKQVLDLFNARMNAAAVNQRALFWIEMKEGETHSRTLVRAPHCCTCARKANRRKKWAARQREPFGTAPPSGERFKAHWHEFMITARRLCQTWTLVVFLQLFSPCPQLPSPPPPTPPALRTPRIALIRDLHCASRCPPEPPRGVSPRVHLRMRGKGFVMGGGILSASSFSSFSSFLHNFIRLGWAVYRRTRGSNSFSHPFFQLHYCTMIPNPPRCWC